jgi:hypothetical protein
VAGTDDDHIELALEITHTGHTLKISTSRVVLAS